MKKGDVIGVVLIAVLSFVLGYFISYSNCNIMTFESANFLEKNKFSGNVLIDDNINFNTSFIKTDLRHIVDEFDAFDSEFELKTNNCVHKTERLAKYLYSLGYDPTYIKLYNKNKEDYNHRMMKVTMYIESTNGMVYTYKDFIEQYSDEYESYKEW